MIIHNLTDRNVPYKPERKPRSLRLRGKIIEPGRSQEYKDTISIAEFSSWISDNMVSVDSLPAWYQEERANEQDKKTSSMATKKAEATAVAVSKVEKPAEDQELIDGLSYSSKKKTKRG
jgi:hypothetical protein